MKSPAQVSAQFADVKSILDQCLAHGGGQYDAPSSGGAVYFRHRCYTFRKQYRDAIAPAASPYDMLTIKKLAPGETKVVIARIQLQGTFTPASGEAVTMPGAVLDDDPLMEEARALREKLGLE